MTDTDSVLIGVSLIGLLVSGNISRIIDHEVGVLELIGFNFKVMGVALILKVLFF